MQIGWLQHLRRERFVFEPGTARRTLDADYQIKQPTSQYFSSHMTNLEWVEPDRGEHRVYPVSSDIRDAAENALVADFWVSTTCGTSGSRMNRASYRLGNEVALQHAPSETAIRDGSPLQATAIPLPRDATAKHGASSHAKTTILLSDPLHPALEQWGWLPLYRATRY